MTTLRRTLVAGALTFGVLWLSAATGRAQPASGAGAAASGACAGGGARMHTLLEKTIFQVDVLTLGVCFGPEATARLDSLLSAGLSPDARADSLARVALEAKDVHARIEFLRDVDLDRFLDGIRENLDAAREAGIVTAAERDSIVSGLPRWYGFLSGRGVREGDEMLYRIRGDTLRTTFRTAGGEVLLDQTDVGPERRLSVLGGYFAPGSDFRQGLIRSLRTGSGGRGSGGG